MAEGNDPAVKVSNSEEDEAANKIEVNAKKLKKAAMKEAKMAKFEKKKEQLKNSSNEVSPLGYVIV